MPAHRPIEIRNAERAAHGANDRQIQIGTHLPNQADLPDIHLHRIAKDVDRVEPELFRCPYSLLAIDVCASESRINQAQSHDGLS